MSAFKLYVYRLLARALPETRCFALKAIFLRWAGALIGANVRICSSAVFLGDGRLVIGDDVWIGAGSVISPTGAAEIRIGSHCDLGPQTMIITGTHEIDAVGEHVAGRGCSKSVEIGDGCWLGARSTILPGVRLARKTLVAAGAVVTRSVEEEEAVVAGVPASIKKHFEGSSSALFH